jgi:hypothetical protein
MPGTHNIGGTITGPGASGSTVTLSGAAAATTTSDASGKFLFGGVADGAYTVTPSKSGVVFTPSSQMVTMSGTHQLGLSFNSN